MTKFRHPVLAVVFVASCIPLSELPLARSSAGRCVSVDIRRGPPVKMEQVSLALTIANGCDATTQFDPRRVKINAGGFGHMNEVALVNADALAVITLEGQSSASVVATYGNIDSSAERICVTAAGADLAEADRTGGKIGCIAVDRDRDWITNEGVLMHGKH